MKAPSNFSWNHLWIVFQIAVNICGLLAFYIELHPKVKDLYYYVHPIRSVVQREASANSMKQDGVHQINSEVTARIALWNNGKCTIRNEDVLDPIKIRVGNGLPILKSSITGVSRKLIYLNSHPCEVTNRAICINFRILENKDGGIVELHYLGNEHERISVIGILEGQSVIRECKFDSQIKSQQEQYCEIVQNSRSSKKFGLTLIMLSTVALLTTILGSFIDDRKSEQNIDVSIFDRYEYEEINRCKHFPKNSSFKSANRSMLRAERLLCVAYLIFAVFAFVGMLFYIHGESIAPPFEF